MFSFAQVQGLSEKSWKFHMVGGISPAGGGGYEGPEPGLLLSFQLNHFSFPPSNKIIFLYRKSNLN